MTDDTEEQAGGLLQLVCPICREAISRDYLDEFPFPEVPCPCCGSLVQQPTSGEDDKPPDNRRKDERFNASLRVTYQSFKRFMIDYTANVSRGGMFIKTKSPYEPGMQIGLALQVPGLESPVRIVGRVVHRKFDASGSEDPGIGIEFTDIDEKSREMLIARVKQLKERG